MGRWTKHESVERYDRVWERFTAPDGCTFYKDATTGKFWKNHIPEEHVLLGYERKHPAEKQNPKQEPKKPGKADDLETETLLGQTFKRIAEYTVERLKNNDDSEKVAEAIRRVNLSRAWKDWVSEQLGLNTEQEDDNGEGEKGMETV